MNIRIGEGWDTHALVVGRPLMLGGVQIPFEKGLLGHSDADVLLHAITDALLGAAGLGDIGQHFPDTDTLDIRNVKLRGQNQDGQRVNALADRALAKGDGSLLTLLGNVQVTQSPNGSKGLQTPTVMRSQEIKAYLKEERLVSDLPVEIRRGTNVFTAQAMQMNSKTGVYELSGKVRGVVHPDKR